MDLNKLFRVSTPILIGLIASRKDKDWTYCLAEYNLKQI